jgi:hypothetical protein
MDEPVQQNRDDVEWGRWMETDKSHWVGFAGRCQLADYPSDALNTHAIH